MQNRQSRYPPPRFEFIIETIGREIRKLQVPVFPTDGRLVVSNRRRRQSGLDHRTGGGQVWLRLDKRRKHRLCDYTSPTMLLVSLRLWDDVT